MPLINNSEVFMIKYFASMCLALIFGISVPASSSQKSASETPGKIEVAQHPLELEPPIGAQAQKLDAVKLRQQADELSSLAQTVPADIHQLTQGKLPRGMVDKLKRIEKLSKNLRSELAP